MRTKNGLPLKVLQFSKCSHVLLLESRRKPGERYWGGGASTEGEKAWAGGMPKLALAHQPGLTCTV